MKAESWIAWIGFEWTLGIVYVNEMFPTEIRATGFGWSVGLGRIVSIAAPIVTQTLAVSIGVAAVENGRTPLETERYGSYFWRPLSVRPAPLPDSRTAKMK
jgi:hypothetical protein